MTSQPVDKGIINDIAGVEEDDKAANDEEDVSGPAEDFGLRVGAPIAIAAAIFLFVAPDPAINLSSEGGEILATTSNGAKPFLHVAGATLVATLFGGLLYPLTGHDPYDEYRGDLAIGAVMLPAAIIILAFVAVILDPMIVDLLNGNVADAVFYFVVAAIVTLVLLLSNVGLIVATIFFGVYLGIPAIVGAYVGTFLGSLAAT